MSRNTMQPPPGQLENASADSIQLNTTPPAIPEVEGLLKWNPNDFTLDIVTGLGTVIQSGQELIVYVYNNSGVDIINGEVTYVTGSYLGRPTVAKANASSHETIFGAIGVATTDILNGGYGFVADFGAVRNIDTSGYVLNEALYLAAGDGNDGKMTNIKPSFPNYAIQIGQAVYIDAIYGVVALKVDNNANDTFVNFWNGTFRESFKFTISVVGSDIIGSLSPANGHPNLTMCFSDGLTTLIATPAITINLIAGIDTNPQLNYVYVPISTKVLTVSTSDWPTEEHIKIGTAFLKSASTTAIDGALKNHNWNDEVQDTNTNQGHLSHIGEAIREKIPATYLSGVDISVSGTPSNIYLSTTQGIIRQVHRHIFLATSMPSDDIHIINHPTNQYLTVTNLNTQKLTSSGESLANSSYSLVIWGVQNQLGEKSHLMCNLPNGKYGRLAPQDSVEDTFGYSVYNIPKEFNGVGFLIARLTFTLDSAGTSFTLYNIQDLRGFIPNSTAGSGAGSSGITTLTGLSDTPSALVANGILRVNSGGTALDFSSALKSGTLASPPSGLAIGEFWEDTTDSASHPIIRMSKVTT